jgi:hypothetical protein
MNIGGKNMIEKQLHAFDTVSTPNGKGILIAQDGCGNYLVAINRSNLVNKTCKGPCLHLWYKIEEITDVPNNSK